MREVAPFVLLACACGAAVSERVASTSSVASVGSAAPAAPDTPPEAFEDLLARGPALAPGMRVIARRAAGPEAVELLRADLGDACIRVTFAASAPVTAKLVDGSGEALATLAMAATEGSLGERGPVCVRKGDVVRAAIEGPAGTRVRWVAWQAP